MYLDVSEHDFINNSNKYSQHKDNFSYDGKKALYKYLVDIELYCSAGAPIVIGFIDI